MHINPKGSTGPIRPETTRNAPLADVSEQHPNRTPVPVSPTSEKTDKVEISDAGRALAARDSGAAASSVDPARAARIRGRILNGAYDTLEVVDAVARRLLDSGDL